MITVKRFLITPNNFFSVITQRSQRDHNVITGQKFLPVIMHCDHASVFTGVLEKVLSHFINERTPVSLKDNKITIRSKYFCVSLKFVENILPILSVGTKIWHQIKVPPRRVNEANISSVISISSSGRTTAAFQCHRGYRN